MCDALRLDCRNDQHGDVLGLMDRMIIAGCITAGLVLRGTKGPSAQQSLLPVQLWNDCLHTLTYIDDVHAIERQGRRNTLFV